MGVACIPYCTISLGTKKGKGLSPWINGRAKVLKILVIREKKDFFHGSNLFVEAYSYDFVFASQLHILMLM